MNYWGLASLHPFGADAALENLSRQGHEHYYPQCLERKIKRGKVRMEPAPLFFGYIFVMITPTWSSINYTKGIASVIMCGSAPSQMRSSEIARIKACEGIDGFVKLAEKPRGKFEEGQKVRSTLDVYDNFIGIYQGDSRGDRNKVLFEMFGRSVPVFVRDRDLVAVA